MENKPKFMDRMKDSLKEREIKKTFLSHWNENKKQYITGAVCIIGTALLMKKPATIGVDINGNHNLVLITENTCPIVGGYQQ